MTGLLGLEPKAYQEAWCSDAFSRKQCVETTSRVCRLCVRGHGQLTPDADHPSGVASHRAFCIRNPGRVVCSTCVSAGANPAASRHVKRAGTPAETLGHDMSPNGPGASESCPRCRTHSLSASPRVQTGLLRPLLEECPKLVPCDARPSITVRHADSRDRTNPAVHSGLGLPASRPTYFHVSESWHVGLVMFPRTIYVTMDMAWRLVRGRMKLSRSQVHTKGHTITESHCGLAVCLLLLNRPSPIRLPK